MIQSTDEYGRALTHHESGTEIYTFVGKDPVFTLFSRLALDEEYLITEQHSVFTRRFNAKSRLRDIWVCRYNPRSEGGREKNGKYYSGKLIIACEDGSVVRDYGGERVPQYIFDHLHEWGFTYDGGQQ